MNKNGFSLIELMITVAIVGILAAIAIPSYNAYVKRANRTDATRTLTSDAQALERCYSQAFTYAGCASVNMGPANSAQGYYTVTITVTTTPTASYSVTAVPRIAPQTADTSCQSFTLNNAGTQSAQNGGGTDTTQTCWGST